MELVKCGAANAVKKHNESKVPFTFCVGTKELWEYMDHNDTFIGFEIENVNDPGLFARMTTWYPSTNALMVDLTGQVAAESIGTYQYSATGGR
jgi:4-hydroxybutyrate CoA-transferase